jgi:hypothetical protein
MPIYTRKVQKENAEISVEFEIAEDLPGSRDVGILYKHLARFPTN